MTTAAIQTVVTMLEQIPDTLQDRVVEHLAEYLTDLKNETQWAESFESPPSPKFSAMLDKVEKQIQEGRVFPLSDLD